MRRLALCVLMVLLGGCRGAERVTIEELARAPETFDVADRVLVEGFAVGEPGSVLVCSGLTHDRPPRPKGGCVQAEGVPLTRPGGDHHLDGTWWSERRELDCLVVRREPVHPRPERLVVSCVPEGARP